MSYFQTYFNIIKLFKKDNFKSEFTSFINILAPIFIISSSLLFLFFIPTINYSLTINIIVLFHILGLSSFFLMIYSLDNATYFGGLGSSREAFVLSMVEITSILFILIFVIISGGNFDTISIHNSLLINHNIIIDLYIIILFIILFIILLAENKRLPFDNPTTHLELTMIHEAMLLETNGPKLTILETASQINLIAFINLIIFLIWMNTYNITSILGLFILYVFKVFILLLILGIIEVFITKMRVFKYQNIFAFLLFLQLGFIIFYIFK